MKKITMFLVAILVAVSFVSVSFAGGAHKVTGEVVKTEGEMVEVKDEKGKIHKLHVNKATKQTGEIKTGAKVEAEMTEEGHANSIAVKEAMKK